MQWQQNFQQECSMFIFQWQCKPIDNAAQQQLNDQHLKNKTTAYTNIFAQNLSL